MSQEDGDLSSEWESTTSTEWMEQVQVVEEEGNKTWVTAGRLKVILQDEAEKAIAENWYETKDYNW